jgi:hypothetical protein
MDGRERAGQPSGGAQFLEGQVGLAGQQCPHLLPVTGHDAGFAARTMVLGAEVTNPAALLEELFDHPNGYPEAASHRLPRFLALIVSRQYPFAQIQRNGFHAPSLPYPRHNGYSFI